MWAVCGRGKVFSYNFFLSQRSSERTDLKTKLQACGRHTFLRFSTRVVILIKNSDPDQE